MVWSLFGAAEEEKPEVKHLHVTSNDDVGALTIEQALECDYERDCTPLYKKIEGEDWPAISKFLQTGYWPSSFFQDSITPADQVKTWVTRFDPADNKKVKWSQLPLHLAIVVDAPFEVLEQLVELYPQAVRCTDDQHMLPLHLAMRHGSSDQIVDFIVGKFPEAVNAKGKNGRTPIECALRSPNKRRARILQLFVEKSKKKSEKTTTNVYSKELSVLKLALADRDAQLADIRAKLSAAETAKEATELELSKTVNEVQKISSASDEDLKKHIAKLTKEKEVLHKSMTAKVEELKSRKLEAEFALQKKEKEIEEVKKRMEETEAKAKAEELSLRKELENVQEHVVQSTSPDDWDSLKKEVEQLKQYRLQHSRTRANADMDELKKHLEDGLKKSEGKAKLELEEMKKQVEKLSKSRSTVASNTELESLRTELDSLRNELKQKEESSKTKVELVVLKKALERELKDNEGKTQEQLEAVRSAIAGLNVTELESKTHQELDALRTELESLKTEIRERQLANKTMQDYEELKAALDRDLKQSEGKTKAELSEMKKVVMSMNMSDIEKKTQEELLSVKEELAQLREALKEKEEASKTKVELVVLKKALESELKNAEGKTKEELRAVKQAVKAMKDEELDKKTNEELDALKNELQSLKDQMALKEEAKNTKQELAELKVVLAQQLLAAEGKTRNDIKSMQAQVSSLNIEQLEMNTKEEFDALKAELVTIKKELQEKEEASKMKLELTVLKKALEIELKKAHGKTNAELKTMKGALKKIDERELENKTKDELAALKGEIEALKKDMKEKEIMSKELAALKLALEEQLKATEGQTKEELLSMKRSLEAIDLSKVESKNKGEWLSMKNELDSLKHEMKLSQEMFTTKQDLEALRNALDIELQNSNGRNRTDLMSMKAAVDSIDIANLESKNADEWAALKVELDGLKKDLKEKEIENLKQQLELELANPNGRSKEEVESIKRTLAQINSQPLELKSYGQLTVLQREIEHLKASGNPDKKQQKKVGGIRKMFARMGFRKADESKDKLIMKDEEGDTLIARQSASFGSSIPTMGEADDDVETIQPPRVSTSGDDSQGKVRSMKKATSRVSQKSELTVKTGSTRPPKSPSATPKASGAASASALEPLPVVRTTSKTFVNQNGEVEVASVSNSDDEKKVAAAVASN